MFTISGGIEAGTVGVQTSDYGGLSSEQITKLAMDKIMKVSETAPPAIRDQAEAFRLHLQNVIYFHLELARKEERASIAQKMDRVGSSEMADLIRRL